MLKRSVAPMLCLLLIAAACAVPTPTPTPRPTATALPATPTPEPSATPGPVAVTLAMGYVPNVQFTPLYVARERGYFAAEGIELTFDYGWETDLLKLLAAGERQFVIGSGDQVALARANGLPVRYVLNWYRRFPVCVVALAESGIARPEDLAGRTVGVPILEGASYIGWRAFLKAIGMEPERVNLQVVGYTQVASLTEKRVEAAVCYALNEPVQLRAAGHDVKVFYLDQYANLPSNGLITNERTIEEQPGLVRGMVRAFLRGLQDTIADPDAAFAITKRVVPEIGGENEALQREVLAECVRFWQGEEPGKSDPASWRAVVDLLRELNLTDAAVDPESLYTNEFVTD
ncbi:MAG: ABC transporter substrate-binding protein [Anaerolineae bacterium]|nr:ABC transporter substrate-binding protein [Anaerolineae bacterium]